MDLQNIVFLNIKNFRPTWGSNPRPWEEEFHALTTELAGCMMLTKRLCLLMITLFPKFLLNCFFCWIKYRGIDKVFFQLRLSTPSNGFAKHCALNTIKIFRPTWGSNPRPWEEEFHALTTELSGLYDDNQETVFGNDHPFSEIFGWTVFCYIKYRRIEKVFLICF